MKTSVVRFASLLVVPVLPLSIQGCTVDSVGEEPPGGKSPSGPVAKNARAAWPDRPNDVPSITREDIARACVERAICGPETTGSGVDALRFVSFCVEQMTSSAERAIPVSGFFQWNERAEYFVRCQLDHAGDCTAQKSGSSDRGAGIGCEEDGCRSTGNAFQVTCEGSVAKMQGSEASFDRDCARAFAVCDPLSPTGCSDRQFSACPADLGSVDRCDGDVRLGCDRNDQVSYHDCSRMEGRCGTTADGEACTYASPPSPQCSDPKQPAATCAGSMLAVCVNGEPVMLSAPGVCPGS
ncbi:MAG TPA: hypothetical protein VK550_31495 [Polyangiaceae bacterium]|nr:hypothetical protein [Polyangiaceae bacterium]